MIESIHIKDFQSIKDAEVTLGQFTVFTGPSSSGKSAFMRALNALTRNSFTPSQVRLGATQSTMSAQVDGSCVKAVRGKAKSTYMLDDEEFTKAGRSVPEAVETLLAMPLVADTESSFATQFDKPFLISEPGATAAKVIGTLTNVSVLHDAMRESSRRRLSINAELKVRNADLARLEDEAKAFEYLPAAEQDWQAAEALWEAAAEYREQGQALERHVSDITLKRKAISESSKDIWDSSEAMEILSEISDSTSILEKLSSTLQTVDINKANMPTWDYSAVPQDTQEFSSLVDSLLGVSAQILRIETAQESTPKWSYTLVPTPDVVDSVFSPVSTLETLDLTLRNILSKVEALQEAMTQMSEASKEIAHAEADLSAVLAGVDVCPLCETPLG